MRRRPGVLAIVLAAACATATMPAKAHDGPPFAIVSDRIAGPYRISIWTDPDTTDDGSPGGQFWVIVEPSDEAVSLPSDTRVSLSITPLDRGGKTLTGAAAPVTNDPARQFVALVMDHEGRFAVRTAIDGLLGSALVDAEVAATYDVRPPRFMLAVYMMPFVLVAFLWVKLLLARRRPRSDG